jgi:transposase InsO family protein
MLIASGTRAVLEAVWGPWSVGELPLLDKLMQTGAVRRGMLVLADRYFTGFPQVSQIVRTGAHLIFRTPSRRPGQSDRESSTQQGRIQDHYSCAKRRLTYRRWDMTYLHTWSGWVYVAFVQDVYLRMIVGCQAANDMRTELPLDALEMALWRRRIKKDSRGHLVQRGTAPLRPRLAGAGRWRRAVPAGVRR